MSSSALWCRFSARSLLLVALMPLPLTGCGGGGSSSKTPDGGSPEPAVETATARFHVDVASGQVTVTRLVPTAGTVGTAAILTGTAVNFASSVLYDQAGSTGLKVLDVSLTNCSGLDIGTEPNGTDAGIRVLFGDITPVSAASDIRNQVSVSKLADLRPPRGGCAWAETAPSTPPAGTGCSGSAAGR